MKIILSRKGFDSSAGGVPSPILPDGRIVSLPIPDARSPVRYGDIGGPGRDIGALVSNLTGGRIRRSSRAHLDPDLIAADRLRAPGWRPLFGQEGAAQGHLRNEGVGPGDLFVFFGLFQRVLRRHGRYAFDPRSPRVHLIWGWLQVDVVVPVAACTGAMRRWAQDHPHLHHPPLPDNVLYLARRRVKLADGTQPGLPGSGVFPHFHCMLQLSDPRAARPSHWRLPHWMHPGSDRRALSYHRRSERWTGAGRLARLRSAFRGQEFVFDTGDYPEALRWLTGSMARLARRRVR